MIAIYGFIYIFNIISLRFKPIFIELSKRLKEYDIVLGEINAFDNRALAIKMKSNSYPALY